LPNFRVAKLPNCLLYERKHPGKEARTMCEEKRDYQKVPSLPADFWRLLFEASPEPMAVTTVEGLYLAINSAYRALYRLDKDWQGQNWRQFYTPEEQRRLEEEIWPRVLSEGRWEGEVRTRRADGEEMPQLLALTRLVLEEEVVGVLWQVRILSQQEQLTERLLRSERWRAVGTMTAGIVHNFNNLLTGILGRAELLEVRTQDPCVREGLADIQEDARRCAELVNKLQKLTDFHPVRSPVRLNPNQLVEDVLMLTRGLWKDVAEQEGRGIRVITELQSQREILGDPAALQEALSNIVLNALEAMPAGGELRLRTWDESGFVHIAISDTGIGIDAATQEHIFEPLFTTKMTVGTGLGLSVAYNAVQRHHGEILVESEVGKGTTFVIRLPALSSPSLSPARGGKGGGEGPAPCPSEPSLSRLEKSHARILVIDDEDIPRQILVETLEEEGYEVVACADGREGVEMFRRQPFDLVFTDLSMPDLNGYEVAKAVKQLQPDTPVILVTGWGETARTETAAELVETVIGKPYDLEEILQAAGQALA